jgi:spore coat protein A
MTAPHSRNVLTRVFLVLAFGSLFFAVQAWGQTILSTSAVPKFVDPLPLTTLDFMPKAPTSPDPNIDYYEIAARPFSQPMLSCSEPTPSAACGATRLPQTPVFGYGPNISGTPVCGLSGTANCFHTPSLPVSATVQRPVRIKWLNQLVDGTGTAITYYKYSPYVQPSTDNHWANPAGNCNSRLTPPDCKGTGAPYLGPVPITPHMHGAFDRSESDGIPEAWFLPASGFSTAAFPFQHGSDYCQIDPNIAAQPADGVRAANCPNAYTNPGSALFQYPNSQNPALLFFHDHVLGATTENVYMGLVGPYILKGTTSNTGTPTDDVFSLPSGAYQVPLVLQDKTFDVNGNLVERDEGNFYLVNGKTWPYLNVEPRKYRFRIVVGSIVHPFVPIFSDENLLFTLIGNDAGFLPHPVSVKKFKISPGERADVVVNFSTESGKTITLLDDNGGPLMQLRVGTTVTGGTDTSTIPASLPARPDLPSNQVIAATENVSILDNTLGLAFPNLAGTSATYTSLRWDDNSTENPVAGTTEIWNMWGFQDSHPMHIHEVEFQVVGRQSTSCASPPCPITPPSPLEAGWKDTVVVSGNQKTILKVQFKDAFGSDRAGLYAWHCHINPHEDNEMMRPMCVLPKGSSPVSSVPDGFGPGACQSQ